MEHTINQIVSEIEHLDYDSQIKVLSRVINLLQREKRTHEDFPASGIKGLCREILLKSDWACNVSSDWDSWE